MRDLPHIVRGRALVESFDRWGQRPDNRFGGVYKKITDSGRQLISDALTEMSSFEPGPKPGAYEWWWARNNMRYSKKIRGDEKRLVDQLMYHFLTDYVGGKLRDERLEKPAKTRKKTRESSRDERSTATQA